MKRYLQINALFLIMVVLFSSCSAIEGIFKAGMGVGIFIVIAIIALVIFIISRFSKKG